MKAKNQDKNKNTLTSLMILTLFLISIAGCRTNSFELGKYASKKSSNMFIFYPDSSFVYRYYGMGYKRSNGKWSIVDNKFLLLNSEIQNNEQKLNVDKKARIDDQFSIKLLVNKNDSDYRYRPIINGYKNRKIDLLYSGCTFNLPDTVKYIQFDIERFPKYFGAGGGALSPFLLRTDSLKVIPGESYEVSVSITDSLFKYRIFTNEKIKVKKNKIIFKDERRKEVLYRKE